MTARTLSTDETGLRSILLMNNLAQNTDPLQGCQQMLGVCKHFTFTILSSCIYVEYTLHTYEQVYSDHDKFRCTDYYVVECVKCKATKKPN